MSRWCGVRQGTEGSFVRSSVMPTMTIVRKRALPVLCVYCDREMAPALTDRLVENQASTLFRCDGCGWEVALPLR